MGPPLTWHAWPPKSLQNPPSKSLIHQIQSLNQITLCIKPQDKPTISPTFTPSKLTTFPSFIPTKLITIPTTINLSPTPYSPPSAYSMSSCPPVTPHSYTTLTTVWLGLDPSLKVRLRRSFHFQWGIHSSKLVPWKTFAYGLYSVDGNSTSWNFLAIGYNWVACVSSCKTISWHFMSMAILCKSWTIK